MSLISGPGLGQVQDLSDGGTKQVLPTWFECTFACPCTTKVLIQCQEILLVSGSPGSTPPVPVSMRNGCTPLLRVSLYRNRSVRTGTGND
eukprot:2598516-Rhodomonas_salina.1